MYNYKVRLNKSSALRKGMAVMVDKQNLLGKWITFESVTRVGVVRKCWKSVLSMIIHRTTDNQSLAEWCIERSVCRAPVRQAFLYAETDFELFRMT